MAISRSGGRKDDLPKGSGGRNGDELPKGSGGRNGDELPKGSGGRGMFGASGSGGGWVVVAFISPTSVDIAGLAQGIVGGELAYRGGEPALSDLAARAQAEARRRETELDRLRRAARQLDSVRDRLEAREREVELLTSFTAKAETAQQLRKGFAKSASPQRSGRAANKKPKP